MSSNGICHIGIGATKRKKNKQPILIYSASRKEVQCLVDLERHFLSLKLLSLSRAQAKEDYRAD